MRYSPSCLHICSVCGRGKSSTISKCFVFYANDNKLYAFFAQQTNTTRDAHLWALNNKHKIDFHSILVSILSETFLKNNLLNKNTNNNKFFRQNKINLYTRKVTQNIAFWFLVII